MTKAPPRAPVTGTSGGMLGKWTVPGRPPTMGPGRGSHAGAVELLDVLRRGLGDPVQGDDLVPQA